MILALDLSSTSTGVCFDGQTETIAPKGSHTHDGDTLTFGCPACIEARRVDQLRASWADMSDDDLHDLWVINDLEPDDDIELGRYGIERGVLTVDQVAWIYPDIADGEEVA